MAVKEKNVHNFLDSSEVSREERLILIVGWRALWVFAILEFHPGMR
jgi:hypothetical protein